MTAIVALFDGRETWIAADGNSHADHYVGRTAAVKIAPVGTWTIALSGHAFMQAAIEDSPECAAAESPRAFFDAAKVAILATGFKPAYEDDAGIPNFQAWGFLARAGGLWQFGDDLFPIPCEPNRPVGAGCGQAEACAGAWVALQMGAKPHDALVIGVRAAEEYCAKIGGATYLVYVPAKAVDA